MGRIRVSNRTDALEKILEARIRQGEYPRESRIPSERELSDELGFSRGTIKKAFSNLHHKGLVRYHKRSYWVEENFAELEIKYGPADRKFYAIFFHPMDFEPRLLSQVETVLRGMNASPVTFNLQSMEAGDGVLDFMRYVNMPFAGAVFISTIHGPQDRPLTKDMLQSLPIPYIFLGQEPFFETNRHMGPGVPDLCDRLLDILLHGGAKCVYLVFSWPLKPGRVQLLGRLSLALDRELAKKIKWKVVFLDGQVAFKPEQAGEDDLLVWLVDQAALASVSQSPARQLWVGLENEAFHDSICCPLSKLAQEGMQWLDKSIQLAARGHALTACPAIPLKPSVGQVQREPRVARTHGSYRTVAARKK